MKRLLWPAMIAFLLPAFSFAASANERLLGTWELESFEVFDSTDYAAGRHPWCANPWGFLTYTGDGYMFAGINCKKSDDPKTPSAEPKDMIFYTGAYKFQGDGVVLHQAANSSRADWIGKDLERHFKFEGDRLVITAPAGSKGPSRLVWKKAKPVQP